MLRAIVLLGLVLADDSRGLVARLAIIYFTLTKVHKETGGWSGTLYVEPGSRAESSVEHRCMFVFVKPDNLALKSCHGATWGSEPLVQGRKGPEGAIHLSRPLFRFPHPGV